MIFLMERMYSSTAPLRNLRSGASVRLDSVEVFAGNAKMGAGVIESAPAPAISLPVSISRDLLVIPSTLDADLPNAKNLTFRMNLTLSLKETILKRTRITGP